MNKNNSLSQRQHHYGHLLGMDEPVPPTRLYVEGEPSVVIGVLTLFTCLSIIGLLAFVVGCL